MICHRHFLCTQENNKQEGKFFNYCLTGVKIQETADLIVEDLGSHALFIGEGNGNPLRYSCLENSMNRRAWWAAVHGVTKTQILLSTAQSVQEIVKDREA